MAELDTSEFLDPDTAEAQDVIQLVGMKLGEEEYAIDVLKIQEIIRTLEITIVPRADNYILGVMNLRGKVIPVIDLRVRFGLERADFDKSTRIIVVRFEKEHIGFVVDEVTQVMRISRTMVEPTPPLVGTVGQEYILGICKYAERLIILLDIDRVVVSHNMEMSDSDLRKRFIGETRPSDVQAYIPKNYTELVSSENSVKNIFPLIPAGEPVLFTSVSSVADEEYQDLLAEIATQSDNIIKPQDRDKINQQELDDLIAVELSKREEETEEILKKKKSGIPEKGMSPGVENANVSSRQVGQDPETSAIDLSDDVNIDDLIAMELAKREAETEALNRQRRTTPQSLSVTAAQDKDPKNMGFKMDIREHTPIGELKRLAGKIIAGESENLDLNIKGEIGELLSLLVRTKSRMDEIDPAVIESHQTLPRVSTALSDVNSRTAEAAFNLLEVAQKIGNYYQSMQQDIQELENALKTQNFEVYKAKKVIIEEKIEKASDLGLHILQALEFQDINEQKIRKIMKSIEELGAHLATLVGLIHLKGNGEEDCKQLLADLGFG